MPDNPDPTPPLAPQFGLLHCGHCRYELRPVHLDRHGDTYIIINGERRVRTRVLCHICGTLTEFRSVYAPELRTKGKVMDIDALEAGRELDLLVSLRVFGEIEEMKKTPGFVVPPYSTDLSAAWEVVEKLSLSVLRLSKNQWSERSAETWGCGRWPEVEYECDGTYDGDYYFWTEANTAPLAVCRSALKAILSAPPVDT